MESSYLSRTFCCVSICLSMPSEFYCLKLFTTTCTAHLLKNLPQASKRIPGFREKKIRITHTVEHY